MFATSFDDQIDAILRGRHGDPFGILGMFGGGDQPVTVHVFAPDAGRVWVTDADGKDLAELDRVHAEGVFAGAIPGVTDRFEYRLRMQAGEQTWMRDDPYRFGPVLGEMDEYLLAEGRHEDLYTRLGAHPMTLDGVDGTSFAVWAPNARRVSVVGNFNAWDGRRHPMRRRGASGVWELFVPAVVRGDIYKYEILGVQGHVEPLKSDPVGFYAEQSPGTASIVEGRVQHTWTDDGWIKGRPADLRDKPVSIYEIHPGSWRRGAEDSILDYAAMGDLLIDYVTEMGFTHVEFLPLSEHPFTGSWGYQPIGMFAPTSRFGSPEQFVQMVDKLHGANIGVIVDWVPAHFPSDAHGLARFDGTALYEHEDPRQGFHKDWNTLIYNFGRREVANFLRSSAIYWLKDLHVDALRVDAVASMLYLDYSRNDGEWIPNAQGGRENLDAIDFLRGTNAQVAQAIPGAATIAEESTAFPGVSRPTDEGGLGFNFKWNMGWMHDTLQYMAEDPINRKYHHDKMTFGLVYAFSENFVLPLSHDEVVHGKGSMLGKMPGDRWQQFANLRAYYGFMWAHPGKKLLFMGGEFGQDREWNHDRSLDWHLLDDPAHDGVRKLIADLNALYRVEGALHERDCDPAGFQWIDGGNADDNVFSFIRYGRDGTDPVVAISNMAPVVREDYATGMPLAGTWQEALNTDASQYGGSGAGNGGSIVALEGGMHGQPATARITLPPLATVFFRPAP